jgi:hypothetical protein
MRMEGDVKMGEGWVVVVVVVRRLEGMMRMKGLLRVVNIDGLARYEIANT